MRAKVSGSDGSGLARRRESSRARSVAILARSDCSWASVRGFRAVRATPCYFVGGAFVSLVSRFLGRCGVWGIVGGGLMSAHKGGGGRREVEAEIHTLSMEI